jgi:hypothetical protein
MPFVESFVEEAFKKDLNTIIHHPMLVNPHATVVMLSFYYHEHLGYLWCIVFPSLGVL